MFFSLMCCRSRFLSRFILSKVGISCDCALAQVLFPYQLETRDENEE
jgi:hypothetical protein